MQSEITKYKENIDEKKIKATLTEVFDKYSEYSKQKKELEKNAKAAKKEANINDGFFKNKLTEVKDLMKDKMKLIKSCFSTKTTPGQKYDQLDCWGKIVAPFLKLIDPTGLVGIVSAFVYPRCPLKKEEWVIK